MKERKENDYLLNMLSNPTFSESDFRKIGLTTENTSLENKEIYKNLEFIKQNPIFQTDGKFDESKLDKVYNVVLQSYNNFAQGITTDKIIDDHKFYRNNIYASFEERNNNLEAKIHREANPLRQGRGLIHANDVMDSPYSVREIAQTQKVWDEATKSWQDAPNESFFNNFAETRVLAQWDDDGEHKDPITGQIVKHKKGQKKINENGTFYYENLNGRDIYGREVLSKFDTLTVDGSFVNKFDFFDSDDKEKSISGTIVRNAIKVIPAFIPYVSPIYLGLRVGLNVTDLFAKLGKVFTGSNSPTLSAIEGFTESMSFSSSDYAKGSSDADIPAHAWSMENILNIGADTFTQLAEQRWLFKFAPSLIKGRAGIQNEFGKQGAVKIKKEALESANIKKSLESRLSAINSSGKSVLESQKKLGQIKVDLEHVSNEIMDDALTKYMKDYHELGKIISQAYMTGITVGDAYGEAKQEGASDVEASLLTLGYALGEYKLLNSDIGKWILPELKSESQRFKQIGKTLIKIPQPSKNASIPEKMNWINKIVNLGKKAADKVYNNTSKNLVSSMTAGSIAEGVEEVSEELLYDAAKSIFNVIGYLRNDETKLSAFDDIVNRYGLSFVGGALGGALASIDTDFRNAKQIKQLDNEEAAFQELVHIVKEGKANEFLSTIDKMTFSSSDLSAIESKDTFGEISYMPGTSKENQDKAAKDVMREQVAIIQRILDANGSLIDDESILGILTNAKQNLKYASLRQSTFAAQFLQEFNKISSDIVDITEKLNTPVSEEVANSEEYKKQQNKLKKELQEKIKQKDDIVKGKRSGEFIKKALWEMSEDISENFIDVNKIQWIESQEKKKIKDITPERLKVLEEKWKDWSEYNRKDKLEIAYTIFEHLNNLSSDILKQYNSQYFDNKRNQSNVIQNIENVLGARIASYTDINITGDYNISDEDLIEVSTEGIGENFSKFNSTRGVVANILIQKLEKINKLKFDEYNQKLNDVFNQESNIDQEKELAYLMQDLLSDDELVNEVINDIKNIPFINYSTKSKLIEGLTLYDFDSITDLDLDLKAYKNQTKIEQEIRNKAYSPVLKLINSWTLGLNNLDINVETLLTQLQVQFDELSTSNSLFEFSIQENNAKRIDVALTNIKMLKAMILAARTDGVSGSNRVGYNVTVNELFKSNLAEINKNDANVLLQDINKVEDKLNYFKRLHLINSGQKLKEHNKVSVNKDIISYNKLKKLVLEHDWPPSDWEGANDLKSVFKDQFEIIDQLDENEDIKTRRLVLNNSERASLKRDSQKIDNAIHNFFKVNQDKLSDPEKLSQLLSSDLFTLKDLDDGLLNIETQSLSDTQFIWWLATRAAIDPNDFYITYKNSFISGIAPIPGQEQAIMMAVAATLNGEIFNNFAKAYNITLGKEVDSLDDDYFKKLKNRAFSKDYLDSDRAIQFFRHFLIEGIAGSGKSTAVAKMIVNILRQSDKGKELLSNIWFVHASKEQALSMAKELGYDDNYEHVYSREEYLEKISPGVTKMREFEGDQLKLQKENLIQRSGETFYRYNSEINKGFTKDSPSLIFMDEVTGFGQQDLLLSEDFMNYYGITSLVFGDFDQDGLEGTMKLENNEYLTSAIFRGNFAGAIKLGDSLRSMNGVKDYNNKQLQYGIYQTLKGEELQNPINLKWWTDGTKENNYQDGTKILGDKVYTSPQDIEKVKSDIDILLKQLPDKEKLEDHEKLGFIYDNTDSEIYKYLDSLNKSGKYKNKILMKKGSSSQGLEADFYVIDLDFPTDENKSKSKFYKKLYTGFTRAKKASVAFITGNQKLVSPSYAPEENPGEFSLSETGIEQYTKDVKKIYDEVYSESGNQLIYKNFKGSGLNKKIYTIKGVNYEQIDKPENINLSQDDTFNYENDTYTLKDFIKSQSGESYVWGTLNGEDYIWELNDFITNILPKSKPSVKSPLSKNERQKELNEFNIDKIDIINSNEDELNMLLHSFATNETGIEEIKIENPNGGYSLQYKVSEGFEDNIGISGKAKGRVDGINGLLKLSGINPDQNGIISVQDYKRLKEILDKVRSAALYSRSQSEITETLTRELGIDLQGLNTRIAFKSNLILEEEVTLDSGFSKFFKSIKEKIKGLFVKEGKHVIPTKKHISIFITKTDPTSNNEETILEIPLLNLTNPLTMAKTKGFEEVQKVIDSVINSSMKTEPSIFDILTPVINKLEKNPVKMSKSFIMLSKIYLEITDGKVLLLDDVIEQKYGLEKGKITLRNMFDITGPLISNSEKGTGQGRHARYYDTDLSYEGQWMNLSDYKRDSGKIVSDIFVIGSPKGDIKVGHPFVIISDAVHKFDPNFTSDEDLLDQYELQMQNPNEEKLVKLVYIAPPQVSVLEYFKNLNSIYKKDSDIDHNIGSDLTSFNLLRLIMEEEIFENKSLIPEQFVNSDSKYSKLKKIVLEFAKLQDDVNPKEFLKLIQSDEAINGVTLKQFSEELLGTPTKIKSWKSFLQSQLRWYTLSEYFGTMKNIDFNNFDPNSIQYKKIQAIEQALSKYNINGIFYSPELNNDINYRNVKDYKRVVNTDGFYKDKSYTINGKIDTTAMKGNVLPLLQYISDSINSGQLKTDTGIYLNDNYRVIKDQKDIKKQQREQFINNFMKKSIINLRSLDKIKELINKYIETNDTYTDKNILNYLNENNYFVKQDTDSGKYIILDCGNNGTISNDSEYLTIDGEIYKFSKIYVDDNDFSYVAEFEIQENIQNNESVQSPKVTTDNVQKIIYVIQELIDKDGGFTFFGIEEFNEQLTIELQNELPEKIESPENSDVELMEKILKSKTLNNLLSGFADDLDIKRDEIVEVYGEEYGNILDLIRDYNSNNTNTQDNQIKCSTKVIK